MTILDLPAVTLAPSGKTMTYGELEIRSSRVANALRALGLDEGDRVVILMGNSCAIEYAEVMSGCARGGFDHLPLNTHIAPSEIAELIKTLNPSALIVSETELMRLDMAAELAQCDPKIVRILVSARPPRNWLSYRAVLGGQRIVCTDAKKPGKTLRLSGGTSGRPKIIVPPAQSAAMADLATLFPSEPDRCLIPTALYHSAPTMCLMAAIQAGAHAVVMEQFDAPTILAAIEQYQVTWALLVPTLMYSIMDETQNTAARLRSLRFILHTAAPVRRDDKHRFIGLLPTDCDLVEIYGGSEGVGLTVIHKDEWLHNPGTVGRAVGGGDIVIRDDTGNVVPEGTVGIVWFTIPDGDTMRYLDNPKATAEAIVTRPDGTVEGSTYDLGYKKGDLLFLAGRGKDMAVIGGANIYPVNTEDAIGSHPDIIDVAVVVIPDQRLGERLAAKIQVRPGCDTSKLGSELEQLYRNQLPSKYQHPVRTVFTEESLGRTPAGKLNKNGIREELTTLAMAT